MSDPGPRPPVGDDLMTAAGFLTRFPVPGPAEAGPQALARSVWAFPIVGLAVGAVGAAVLATAGFLGVPPLVGAGLAVLTTVAATGGLHEDGLADFADGAGGTADRGRALEIMRDSRIGTYGVLALVLTVGVRVAALAAVAPGDAALLMLAAESLSRGIVPQVMTRLPPARSDGLAHGAGRPGPAESTTALVIAAGLCLALLGLPAGGLSLVAAAAAAWAVAALANARLGGHTGDVLGAVQQASVLAILVAGPLVLSLGAEG